ncbi:hypothetical protein SAMN05421504_108204 [Amycolatopsis xylanica]|uniref:DUF1440 domain-containing protein n=1 Tax=Amycolatopsis xylanica TaxID=589385 RepID=A0A1H3PGE0_9PSEU|nr:hypothetical protein [Amycolatopsis xylanica]SDZ00190.1 hypothetical protein SAMN05421504_108204 [Amycolatopsis xylanica]
MSTKKNDLAAGVVAGLAGTAAYTVLSSRLKKRAVRQESVQPLTALTAREPESAKSTMVNASLHWGYGAWGGIARALVAKKLTGAKAEVAHLAVIWLPWRLLLAASKAKNTRIGKRELAVDFVKHATYVLVTGAAHRALSGRAVPPAR